MSIDEAIAEINSAPSGRAHEVALGVIARLDDLDKLMAGGDLEEMAIILDNS